MAKYKRFRAKRDQMPEMGQTVTDSKVKELNDLQDELPEEEGLTAKELASLKKKGKKSARAKKLARKAVE
jgi:hypothetical protein